MKIVILYVSREGQTKKIAEYMAVGIERKLGVSVEMYSIEDMAIDSNSLINYDFFILGCSVRYGKHHRLFLEFVQKNYKMLDTQRSCFYSVNLIARKPHRNSAKTNPYVSKFLKKTHWKPFEVGVFPGAVYYSKYNIFIKIMIKIIMKLTKGEMKKDVEYTSWQQVDNFIDKLIKKIG